MKRKIERMSFRHIFVLFSIITGIIILLCFWYFKLNKTNLVYLWFYLFLSFLTYFLIKKISQVNEMDDYDIMTKLQFFWFIGVYFLIIIGYITIFAILFIFTYILNNGYFVLNQNYYPLTISDAFFISGITFVSYDVGYLPVSLMRLFIFIEVFIAQIIILGFLFIVFGKLLAKIKI